MNDSPSAEPVEDTVQRLADLHREQEAATTGSQKLANRVTGILGRPGFVAGVLALILLWIIGNAVAVRLGARPLDIFPFPDLALTATVAAFVLALIILSTQRHEDELATKRAQLTLQIALLSEQKVAKIIALLEEQRRDNPMLASRIDHEADAMAKGADPRASLEQIEASHRD